MPGEFHTTRWSLVLAAQGGAGTRSRRAMADLCESYWEPLYVFVRRQGYGPEEAKDLTQAYFAHVLEKDFLRTVSPEAGRFRSFLLTSLQNLLIDERRRETALKRGGGNTPITLDIAVAERLGPSNQQTPETVYERRWAATVLRRALGRVQEESEQQGQSRRFERLKGYLAGGAPSPSYERVAAELGMTVEAVAVAVHRLRRRYGEALREEVAQTVASPDEIDDEIRHLLGVFTSGASARA